MAKTKWTRRRRLNLDTALLVDTLNNEHTPTIHRVDNRYDFLELPNTAGSISLFFEVKFNTNSSSDLIKIVGTSKDLDQTKMNNGWHISVRKSTRQLYLWNGRLGSAGNNYYVALYNANIEEGKTYHLAITKNGAFDYKVYLNAIEVAKGEYALTADSFVTNNPITLGGNTFLEGKAPKGEVTVSHFAIFNKILAKAEINYLYTFGGVLPESAHASCIGYWTCQDKTSNKLIDSVEQFNYAKADKHIQYGSAYNGTGGWANISLFPNSLGLYVYSSLLTATATLDFVARNLKKIALSFPDRSAYGTLTYTITDNANGAVLESGDRSTGGSLVVDTDTYNTQNVSLNLTATKTGTNDLLIQWGSALETFFYKSNNADLIDYPNNDLAIYNPDEIELLVSHNFNSPSAWILQSAWSFVNGKAVLNGGSGNGNGYLYQTINLAKGGLYKITYQIDSLTQGYISLNSYSNKFGTYAGSAVNRTVAGTYTEYLFLPSGPCNLYVTGNNNCIATLSYVSLKLEAETGKSLPTARQDFYGKQQGQHEMLYLNANNTVITFDKSPDMLRTYADAYTYYGYISLKDTDVQNWGSCLFTTTETNSRGANGLTIKLRDRRLIVQHTGNAVHGAGGGTNAFQFNKQFPVGFFESPRHLALRKSAMVNGVCTFDLFVDGILFESKAYSAPAFPAAENLSVNAVPRLGWYIGDYGGFTHFKGYYGYFAFSKTYDSEAAIESAANFKLPDHADVVLSTFLRNHFSIKDNSAAGRKAELVSFRIETNKEEITRSGYGQTPLTRLDKAIVAPSAINPIQLPTTISSIGNNNFSLYFTVHFNKAVTLDDGLFYQLNCSGAQFQFYKGRLLILLSHIYYLEVMLPEYLKFSKGFYSICIQKVGERNTRAFINGRKTVVSNVGTGMVDAPYMVENDDIFLTNISANKFYSNASDLHLVNYGIYKGSLAHQELIKLHNNSLLNNPENLNNWACYYQFNTQGTSWEDKAGKCAAAYCALPVPVADLNSLR